MLPRHALSSFMVWNAGVGPWWAATVSPFEFAALFQNMPLTTFTSYNL